MDFKTTVDDCDIEVSLINRNVLVFVPGIPGHANSREIVAAHKAILDDSIASTFRYTSRRDLEAFEEAKADRNPYGMMMSYTKEGVGDKRINKTHQDEFRDLKVAMDFALDENPSNIYLSGFSFGGGLATLLLDESYAGRITKVLLTSPQIYAPDRDGLPCFGGFPDREKFLEVIAGYEGELLVVHHEDDPVVAAADVAELVSRAGTDKKEFRLLEGANHGFGHDVETYAEMHRDFFL
ncbi:alpha/beta hydrolase [archaeon]|jgi:dienelactone hydrolase|nr:alpha/beta hydrolase [archaeon]MBT4416882.1 alpha/beta hydrolase [archaeon]